MVATAVKKAPRAPTADPPPLRRHAPAADPPPPPPPPPRDADADKGAALPPLRPPLLISLLDGTVQAVDRATGRDEEAVFGISPG
jgi:hypothetical protein